MIRVLFFALFFIHCQAGITNHYRKLETKLGSSQIENVDHIYLINLDQRPERWSNCLTQLLPYGILPERFPGIYGWTLSPAELNGMALIFQPGMWTGPEYVMHFPLDGDGTPQWAYLSEAFYGKGCFSGWTVKGTIGCSLSHLSVLNDAYHSGYETIWVMEDDIEVREDPRQLSYLIKELDSLVGHDGWDAFYTDYDALVVDPNKDLLSEIPIYYWRPDMPYRDIRFLAAHYNVGEHFTKVGSRIRQHSVIYSRHGIEKILNFYRIHGNFLPYDTEIALIPGIRLYTSRKNIVSVREVDSDTRDRHF